jgi:hypothetical protein
MASAVAPYRRLFREYIRSVRVYGLTRCIAIFSEYAGLCLGISRDITDISCYYHSRDKEHFTKEQANNSRG